MLEPRDEVFAASEGVRRCARRHIALSVRFGEDSTMIFGLSPFLGYRFVPRLRDLPERRLASIARPGDYPGLKAIMGDIVAAVRAIQNEQIAAVRAVLERWSAAARASTGKRQAHDATAAKSAAGARSPFQRLNMPALAAMPATSPRWPRVEAFERRPMTSLASGAAMVHPAETTQLLVQKVLFDRSN